MGSSSSSSNADARRKQRGGTPVAIPWGPPHCHPRPRESAAAHPPPAPRSPAMRTCARSGPRHEDSAACQDCACAEGRGEGRTSESSSTTSQSRRRASAMEERASRKSPASTATWRWHRCAVSDNYRHAAQHTTSARVRPPSPHDCTAGHVNIKRGLGSVAAPCFQRPRSRSSLRAVRPIRRSRHRAKVTRCGSSLKSGRRTVLRRRAHRHAATRERHPEPPTPSAACPGRG